MNLPSERAAERHREMDSDSDLAFVTGVESDKHEYSSNLKTCYIPSKVSASNRDDNLREKLHLTDGNVATLHNTVAKSCVEV